MKRLSFLVMAVALTAGLILSGSWALGAESFAAESRTDTLGEIASQFADPSNDPFGFVSESDKKKQLELTDSVYPAKFDLRDVDGVSYVTPVKFQNPWNNCWGFAAIAAAETSILGDEELRGNFTADLRGEAPDSGKVQLDLSEKHLSYFARTAINDPDNPQNGEGSEPFLLPDMDLIEARYDLGGFAPTATSVFASGVGPVLESENPLFEYRGAKGRIEKQWVQGAMRDFSYSKDDDWVLDESLRFSNSFALKESFAVPSPAKLIDEEETTTYEFNEVGVRAIKEQLYNKRGVEIGYLDSSFNEAFEDHGEYISGSYSHYTYCPQSAQHAVCIVGWDDKYPAERFRHEVEPNEDGYTEADTVPPGDGAWLVKNSWGSGEEDFPNRGEGTWGYVDENSGKHTGYFWLSYYDQSIATPEALDFEPASDPGGASTNVVDQYDYMPVNNYYAAHVSDEVRTANVFEARVCEELKKVSCETTYPNTEVTFDVYLLAKKHGSPTEGLLMDTVTQTFQYGGFHKVDLNKPFMVMRGQSYAIVVTQRVPEDGGSMSYSVAVRNDPGTSVVNKGESFLQIGGEWLDFSDKDLQKELMGQVRGAYGDGIDNFPIKGYGEEKPDTVLTVDYSGVLTTLDPETGEAPESYFLSWITDNSGRDDLGDLTPVWNLAEGGEDVIDVIDGRDPSRKTVKCKKLGWTYLTATVEGVGTAIISVKVDQGIPWISKMKAGKNSLTLTLSKEADTTGLDGYVVFYRIKGASKWSKKEFSLTDPLKLTGLKNGKRYEVNVHSFVETRHGRYYSDDGIDRVSGAIGLKNTLRAKGRSVSVRAADLKKGSVSIDRKKAIKVSKAKGTVTYTIKSGIKGIKVNKKSGKITLKKGLKKGKYSVKIKVRAAGKGAYLPATRTVTVKVKVN